MISHSQSDREELNDVSKTALKNEEEEEEIEEMGNPDYLQVES